MGARGYQEALAHTVRSLYADWGMTAARAAARMRLERVRFVGIPRPVAGAGCWSCRGRWLATLGGGGGGGAPRGGAGCFSAP